MPEQDTYLDLNHSKRKEKHYIFDGYNFLTFDYGGRVYNILIPSPNRYKKSFLADGLNEQLSKFLKIHRIVKLRSIHKEVQRCKRDNFIYCLKEAEYKFNYKAEERVEIITSLWLNRESCDLNDNDYHLIKI